MHVVDQQVSHMCPADLRLALHLRGDTVPVSLQLHRVLANVCKARGENVAGPDLAVIVTDRLDDCVEILVVLFHLAASQVQAVVATADVVDAELSGDGRVRVSAVGYLSDGKIVRLIKADFLEGFLDEVAVSISIETLRGLAWM